MADIINLELQQMQQVSLRISGLLDKLRLIGSSEDAKTLKKAIPIWMEITDLRGRQLEYLERQFAVLKQQVSEAQDQSWDNEERIMALESIPMTENLAQAFIRLRGLDHEFEAFIESEVDRVTDEALRRDSGGTGNLH